MSSHGLRTTAGGPTVDRFVQALPMIGVELAGVADEH